jgi:Capsule polysaccharide biosynthesis protein
MPTPQIHFHMPLTMAESWDTLPGFYKRLRSEFAARGVTAELRYRDIAALDPEPPAHCFDFVHNGRVQRPRTLNTGLGYIRPFWYADPIGVLADSSLAGELFDPQTVPAEKARQFCARQRSRLIATRSSRHPQPDERQEFPEGCIAVFLQGVSDPIARSRHMDAGAMLAVVLAHRGGRPLVVKPHPNNHDQETMDLIAMLLADHPDVIVTGANVHDILRRAAVTVSVSSAVALEGMLHGKPAVLFGRADFHHVALTVQQPSDWPAALRRAMATDWDFEPFLYWFLAQGMINAGREDMFAVLLARMVLVGADLAALGLAD